MKTILVLAMHGAPPNDFPTSELAEFMNLHNQLEHVLEPRKVSIQIRYLELQAKLRAWPRTSANDPFFAGSITLAKHLEEISELPVVLGFNEFCGPSLEEALEQAATKAKQVLVITPMMTRGGEHSERDIPTAIRLVQAHHPGVIFKYVWPFDTNEVARFLSDQLKKYQ